MRLSVEPSPLEIEPLRAVDILGIAGGSLAALVALALVFRFSIEVPTLALVAASVGLVVTFKAWSSHRLARWTSAAAILFTLLSATFYVRHVDGIVARERQAVAKAEFNRDEAEVAGAQREAQKQSVREAAAREERLRREAAEEAARLENDKREAAALATLRKTNPDRYLERIKAKDNDLWLKEARLLRPGLYEAYLKQQKRKQQGVEYTDAKLPSSERPKP